MGAFIELIIVIGIFVGVYYYFLNNNRSMTTANIINGVIGFIFLDQFMSQFATFEALLEIIAYFVLLFKGKKLMHKYVRRANFQKPINNQMSQHSEAVKQNIINNPQTNMDATELTKSESANSSIRSHNARPHNDEKKSLDKLKQIEKEQIKQAANMNTKGGSESLNSDLTNKSSDKATTSGQANNDDLNDLLN